jgi:hypothetical protein
MAEGNANTNLIHLAFQSTLLTKFHKKKLYHEGIVYFLSDLVNLFIMIIKINIIFLILSCPYPCTDDTSLRSNQTNALYMLPPLYSHCYTGTVYSVI